MMSKQSRRRHLTRIGQAPPAMTQDQAGIHAATRAAIQKLILAPQWEPVEKLVALYMTMVIVEQPGGGAARVPVRELAEGLGVCEDCIWDAVDALVSSGGFVIREAPHAAD